METEEKRKMESDEIVLLDLLQELWEERKRVLKVLFVFSFLGLFIAIFSDKEYTASTVMIPLTSGKGKVSGSLGGLAAMAGINLGEIGMGEVIPPTLYPKVVESIPFKKAMLKTALDVSEVEGAVSFENYYTDIHSLGLLSWIKKYTIGLPGLILKSIRTTQKNDELQGRVNKLLFVSQDEKDLYEELDDKLQLEVNDKEGYISLTASMPEAISAAQMAKHAQELLQRYIIEFKSKKAKEQLKFIEERFLEKEKDFRKKESALASFQDRNKNVISAQTATREKRLQADYNLAYNVYLELAKQIEQQKIQVKEDTPVFTIIEPVSVPVEKSKPKRAMILAIWIFLGLVVGIGWVFARDFFKNLKC